MLYAAVVRFADDLVLSVQIDDDGVLTGTLLEGETVLEVSASEGE